MKNLSIDDLNAHVPLEGKTIKSMKFDEDYMENYLVITCTDGTICSIHYDYVYEYTIQQNSLETTMEQAQAITLTPIQLKVLRSFFNTGTIGTEGEPRTPKERKELQELLEILGLTDPASKK